MDDNSGMMIGMAIGLDRRMRQDAENHAWELSEQKIRHEEDLANFQAGIDQVRVQRDTFEARLIARNHQVTVLIGAVDLLAKSLPAGHPFVGTVEEVDMTGRPMSHLSKAVGNQVLRLALSDKEPYFETLREVAKLVGVRTGDHHAMALRAELARTGRAKTGIALRDALGAATSAG